MPRLLMRLFFLGCMTAGMVLSLRVTADTAEPDTVTVTVTARRWLEPLQVVPESVTVVSREALRAAGLHTVAEAVRQTPNVTQPDFSARWLSFPFMRGIGSGRNSPAVTTIIDGVPQLSYATGNQELLGVAQIDVLRGPQGSRYGRNTLGGVVQVLPELPAEEPTARVQVTLGNYGLRDLRGEASGLLGAGLRGSLHLGNAARDGFTTNDVSGDRLDARDAWFGRGQLYWPGHGAWTLRLSATTERDHDGDYALGDLAAMRAAPHHVAHDFEGFNRRTLQQPVFTATRPGRIADFTSITALQEWTVRDRTDADFSPADYLRRGTVETQQAWTQELRFSSPERADGHVPACRWLAGAFLFTSRRDVDNATEFRLAAANAQGVPVPFTLHDTGLLRNAGLAPYGQLELALGANAALTLGLRHDYERKTAHLRGYYDPAIAPDSPVTGERTFNRTSPQVSLAYRLTRTTLWYATAANGYKTGGFNAQAPAGRTAYGEETSRSYETGVKTTWLHERLLANLCLFRLDWEDIQLDVPGSVPGLFYIDNAGAATSQGGEVELTLLPARGWRVFTGAGMLDTAFKAGSQASGVDVSGHRLPFAPALTLHAGAQFARQFSVQTRALARIDVQQMGKYYYDAANAATQSGYALANLRLAIEHGRWRAEGWTRNLFNRRYVPVAFPVPLAPSGYVGESGAPRTCGLTLGYTFP